MKTDFKTIPDELILAAQAAMEYLLGQGYQVSPEGRRIGFPLTPALVCDRGHETLIVEVASILDEKRVMRWIKYCRSQTSDTRFAIVIRALEAIPAKAMRFVSKEHIGIYMHDDDSLTEVRQSVDLAMRVELPELCELPEALRPILAPSFAKFATHDWRDGLSDAYQVAEDHAREYLKAEIDAGRVTVMKNKTTPFSGRDVDLMTLGQLKDAFGKIQNQTHRESLIYKTLEILNQTRPKLAHHKGSPASEAAIRQSAGNHMYTVVSCWKNSCVERQHDSRDLFAHGPVWRLGR